jgi:sec-independent protein translocase protein TatB
MVSPPPIQLATLSMWDTLLLMVLALVVFGPRRLPKIGRQLGKLMYEFRKASNDFKFQMEEELRNAEEADRRKKEEEEERQRALLAATPAPAQLESTAPPPQVFDTATPDSSNPAVTEELKTAETTDSPVDAGPVSAESKDPKEEAAPPAEPSILNAHQPSPGLNIQPPSTGEKIAAEPPGKTQGSLFPEAEGSEPAAHNG